MSRFALFGALAAAFLAAPLVWAAPASAETAYFSAIEDLPIAPGLSETADRFDFADAAAGVRIIGASARGRGRAEDARAFYRASLPALGWAVSVGSGGENETVYLRARQHLSLSFRQRADQLELDVQLISEAPPGD